MNDLALKNGTRYRAKSGTLLIISNWSSAINLRPMTDWFITIFIPIRIISVPILYKSAANAIFKASFYHFSSNDVKKYIWSTFCIHICYYHRKTLKHILIFSETNNDWNMGKISLWQFTIHFIWMLCLLVKNLIK